MDQPLDAGQEAELRFLRSQRGAWVNQSLGKRMLVAGLAIALLTSAVSGFVALIGGPWVLAALITGGLAALLFGPHVVAPERMLRASVRSLMPTAEAMRRGDQQNRNWPG